jgi:hypothetical protein
LTSEITWDISLGAAPIFTYIISLSRTDFIDERTYMNATEAQELCSELVHEIELAEEKWVHEVIEELEEELALEEHFRDCIQPVAIAVVRQEAEELVLVEVG